MEQFCLQMISMRSFRLYGQKFLSGLNPLETTLRAKLKPHIFLKTKLAAGQRIYGGIHQFPTRKGTT